MSIGTICRLALWWFLVSRVLAVTLLNNCDCAQQPHMLCAICAAGALWHLGEKLPQHWFLRALECDYCLGCGRAESLRLFPPLIMLLRQAKASFAVTTSQGKTYVIPKARACKLGLQAQLLPTTSKLSRFRDFRLTLGPAACSACLRVL